MNRISKVLVSYLVITGLIWAPIANAGLTNPGLIPSNNLSDVSSASTSLTNLGGLSTSTAATTYLPKASPASTGTYTPAYPGGIVGNATGSAVTAGSVGEAITATGTAVSLTSGVSANITSISLTAGDWDVWGNVVFNPAGTTVFAQGSLGINTTSATAPASPFYSYIGALTFNAGFAPTLIAPQQRINVSTTTTVYLVGTASFTVSTMTATGYIYARRR